MIQKFLVAVLALGLFACQPGDITIENTNTQSVFGPSDIKPTPTPVPGAGGTVAKVTVGFFGRACPGPTPAVPTDLHVGCTGRITATPKDAAGNKLEAKDHGNAIRWFYEYGQAVLRTTPDGDNDFNRDAVAAAVGDYRLCAEVRSVIGCVEGAVIP